MLFFCSPADRHLGFFHLLTVIDSAAVDMHIHICLGTCFQFFWYVLGYGIAGLYGNSMCNFLRNHQTVFLSG